MGDIEEYRPQIEAALEYAGHSHSFDDVAEMVRVGKAQLWPAPHSVIVTEVIEEPQHLVLHFFLAGGDMRELQTLTPVVLGWGKKIGCTKATLIGRKGWARSFLASAGWVDTQLVVLEKAL